MAPKWYTTASQLNQIRPFGSTEKRPNHKLDTQQIRMRSPNVERQKYKLTWNLSTVLFCHIRSYFLHQNFDSILNVLQGIWFDLILLMHVLLVLIFSVQPPSSM